MGLWFNSGCIFSLLRIALIHVSYDLLISKFVCVHEMPFVPLVAADINNSSCSYKIIGYYWSFLFQYQRTFQDPGPPTPSPTSRANWRMRLIVGWPGWSWGMARIENLWSGKLWLPVGQLHIRFFINGRVQRFGTLLHVQDAHVPWVMPQWSLVIKSNQIEIRLMHWFQCHVSHKISAVVLHHLITLLCICAGSSKGS